MKHFLITTIALLLLISCTNKKTGTEQLTVSPTVIEEPYQKPVFDTLISTEDILSLSETSNEFGIKMLQHICETTPDGNICISPSSFISALAMAANGADGQTRSEIIHAIGLDSIPMEQINKWQHKLLSYRPQDDSIIISKANLIAVNQNLRVSSYFQDLSNEMYRAKVENIDVHNRDKSIEMVNQWCQTQTNGKIEQIVTKDSFDEFFAMLLVNVVCFKGSWSIPFSGKDTKREFFHSNEGKIKVDMMNKVIKTPNCHPTNEKNKNLPFRTFNLDYKDDRFTMLFLLPNEGISIDSILTLTTAELLFKCSNAKSKEIQIKVPKVKFDYEQDAKDPLNSLGIRTAFSDSADFSAMLPNERTSISKIFQKTSLEIMENGSEASAATVVQIILLSARLEEPKYEQFFLNRPYMFFILDKEQKEILFAGRITNPSK